VRCGGRINRIETSGDSPIEVFAPQILEPNASDLAEVPLAVRHPHIVKLVDGPPAQRLGSFQGLRPRFLRGDQARNEQGFQ
jgi:hypothetical protein